VHCLRDLTRGGLATALIEIARTAGLAMRLEQAAIPVSDPVRGACEILGLDSLYVANEGRFVAFVPEASAERALATLRGFHESAAIVGAVEQAGEAGDVALQTLGGSYVLDLLTGDQLPRIC
jgi:hydrogenase expression/formation protein HypE